MQAPTSFPKLPAAHESPPDALVRLFSRHALEDSLREILAAMQAHKQQNQHKARLALLEHLPEGQPPLAEAELPALPDE